MAHVSKTKVTDQPIEEFLATVSEARRSLVVALPGLLVFDHERCRLKVLSYFYFTARGTIDI
jgi:hypothetical protein